MNQLYLFIYRLACTKKVNNRFKSYILNYRLYYISNDIMIIVICKPFKIVRMVGGVYFWVG